MKAAALALALVLAAGPARAASGCRQMARYQGTWSGRQTCKSGKYGVAFILQDGAQGPSARYSATDADGARSAAGTVRFLAGPRAETCTAVAATPLGELRFQLGFSDKGRRILFRVLSLRLMGADMPPPGSVSGSADFDQGAAKVQYRFVSALPMAADTCGGTLTRSGSR